MRQHGVLGPLELIAGLEQHDAYRVTDVETLSGFHFSRPAGAPILVLNESPNASGYPWSVIPDQQPAIERARVRVIAQFRGIHSPRPADG